jgi:hypothetical protein
MGSAKLFLNMYHDQIENRAGQPVQTAPNSNVPTEPSLFTQPDVLHFINCRKWARFLSAFAPELHQANLTVPDPDHLNGHDIFWFARFFANSNLPEKLRKALRTLETAADPTNEGRIDRIFARRFPQDNFGHLHPLDRALELWFNAREELAPFEPNPPAPPAETNTPTNPLPAPSATEGNHHENGESQSGMNNHEQNPPPPNLLGNQTENQKPQNPPEPFSAVSPQIENRPAPNENGPALPATDASIEHGNSVETETPAPPSAETQSPIANQKSKIENSSDNLSFARLAKLSPADYDRCRLQEASSLKIRVETLDKEIARFRTELEVQASIQAIIARISTCEPWPEPIIDPASLFHEIGRCYNRYLVLPPGAADALVLWDAGTHVFEAFIQFPRLNLSSPIEGCGKSTAMDLTALFVRRPLQSDNLRAAVLFRIVESVQPTLLLDEIDTYLPGDDELRGLLNSGHKTGATVFRAEGEGRVRPFNAYAPAALAGIGQLPGTVHSRSIHIPLAKAGPGELPAHLDRTQIEPEKLLARKLARWAQDNFAALKQLRPVLPSNAYNRLGDNWRPLFAIAELVGGDWPARCLASFNHLTSFESPATQQDGVRLLGDIKAIFTELGVDRISSKDLADLLCDVPHGHWLEANKGGRPITETWLGRQLNRFQIHPRRIRLGDDVLRGYLIADFKDTFTRFLRPT